MPFTTRRAPGARRIEWLLFAGTFLAFAYFHQGGGWNQNGRLALVRAIVEEGTIAIDSFLVYAPVASPQGPRLARVPVRNGEFRLQGNDYAFRWRDRSGRPVPLDGGEAGDGALPGRTFVEPSEVACTGDVAFYRGHFHPNKAPGTSLLAVPGYFLVFHLERLLGLDPDGWRTLTVNAWLVSVLSVGLLSALGCVLFHRLALIISNGRALPSLLTALALAFGTMFFPYGTMLYEHNVVAVSLVAAFYLLYRARNEGSPEVERLPEGRARLYVALAGLCAGFAAITNYLMAVAVVILGAYAVLGTRRARAWAWFGLGVAGPFLLVCAYNVAAFSTPFTTNYAHENPAFKSGGGAFLDIFVSPQWDAIPAVLLSPFRGLFFTAPVLLMGVYGLATWFRGSSRREAWLSVAIVVFLLTFMSTFNAWHGGWAVGPRYLSPAVPFLALPLVAAFVRYFKTTCALAAASVAVQLLVTAVDPQSPVGVAPLATIPDRPRWSHDPVTEYEWPLFFEGQALPLVRAQRDEVLRFYEGALQARGEDASARAGRISDLRSEIDEAVRAGNPAPLLLTNGEAGPTVSLSELPTLVGPVSVNPVGVYESWMYQVFPAHSTQASWNSFNVGELVFERSRWSLMPLLAAVGAAVGLALRHAARLDRDAP